MCPQVLPECVLCGGIFGPGKELPVGGKCGLEYVGSVFLFLPEVVLPVSAAVPLDYFGEVQVKFCCKK